MYDVATDNPDRIRAAAAMAEVLRTKLPKPKAPKVAPDLLTAETLIVVMKRICMIVERCNSIPILSCVALESADGKLILSATDLDMLYVETMRAPDLPPFRMAINAYDLAAGLRGCTGEVTFRDDTVHPAPGATVDEYDQSAKGTVKVPAKPKRLLTMLAGGAELRFPGFLAANLPIMTTPDAGERPQKPKSATMPTAALLEPLAFVQPAISAEETRYYLNGVYMHTTVENGSLNLNFVSTDGSRLLKSTDLAPAEITSAFPAVILPRKSVGWILRNVRDDEVQVDAWASHVRLTTATGTFLTKVIDGSFPDYARIIPKNGEAKTVLGIGDAKSFSAMITKLISQSKEKTTSVTIDCREGGDVLGFGRNHEGGSVSAELPSAIFKGAAKLLAFNGRFLAEMVGRGEDVVVTMDMGGPNDPTLFLWPDQPGRCGVLMPLRV